MTSVSRSSVADGVQFISYNLKLKPKSLFGQFQSNCFRVFPTFVDEKNETKINKIDEKLRNLEM